MADLKQFTQDEEIRGWERISFTVDLSDLQSIVIVVPAKYNWGRNPVTNNWEQLPSKELRKFRVSSFDYDLDNHETKVLLKSVKGNYYLKDDKQVGKRQTWLPVREEIIDLIPDSLFDLARKHFTNDLAPRLQKIIDTGVVIR